ncbi:DUF192 domain-containing protein [Sphingomonadaceae bacterium LXI357]|uniref:DUF192 domain-containing protein n=2 Tax=Stakelama marina TaxID=2826939 RepID=A0A8T4I9C6_9SPHN|nr:DUF192 domain-containing protein [Stakelama marina]
MPRTFVVAVSAALLGLCAGCTNDGTTAAANDATATAKAIPLTIKSANGAHVFQVELAQSAAEQERGLMYRRNLADDFGMLFWPYPAGGGAPREASFWMKNTPSPLDIIFIRADGTIARIAENAVPFDTTPISSGEPVGAVLEIRGGRSSELGIAEGDKVSWDHSAG